MKQQQCSYYGDSKLYMHYLTMEVNRRFDCHKPYSLSYDGMERLIAPSDEQRRPVVGISVSPGAVRSDIWRSIPGGTFKRLLDCAMWALFLDVQQGAATSVYAAILDIELLRRYQVSISVPVLSTSSQRSTYQVQDKGGRMCLRADCPYLVPYYTTHGILAFELFGVYAGPRFSPITLPKEGLRAITDTTPSDPDDTVGGGSRRALQPLTPSMHAIGMWEFSAELCRTLLLKGGCASEDLEFLN